VCEGFLSPFISLFTYQLSPPLYLFHRPGDNTSFIYHHPLNIGVGMRERVSRVHNQPLRHLIYLSISHVLATTAILSLLLLDLSNYFNYGVMERVGLSLWSLLLLGGSYLFYRQVRHHIDFFDYMASLIFYHKLRERSKILDATNTILFFGLLLITISPFLHSYLLVKGYHPTYASFTFFLGGLMVALAVSGYVLMEED
jgi:hypothetical protein